MMIRQVNAPCGHNLEISEILLCGKTVLNIIKSIKTFLKEFCYILYVLAYSKAFTREHNPYSLVTFP